MSDQQRQLRKVLGTFATGVTIVGVTDKEGRPAGLTANSFTSVSLDPPLVLVCIHQNADCRSALVSATHFAVNVLSSRQRHLSHRFATKHPDKWSDVRYETGVFGVPLLPQSIAQIECETVRIYEEGDHLIMIGHVLRADHDTAGEPLIFYSGNYAGLNPAQK